MDKWKNGGIPIEAVLRGIDTAFARWRKQPAGARARGTTLAAAELNERVCYGIELDPKYVDVIVQRWQALTDKKATLDGDGETFQKMKSVPGRGDRNG